MSRNIRKTSALTLCALLAGGVALAPAAQAVSDTKASASIRSQAPAAQPSARKLSKIVLVQAVPVLTTTKSASGGAGTLTIFGAKLTSAKGAPQGALTGSMLTVEVDTKAAAEVRERSLTFALPAGQILARGVSVYPTEATEMQLNKPVVIAVIGGTGKYIGANGEVITTRLADGSYKHVITLVR